MFKLQGFYSTFVFITLDALCIYRTAKVSESSNHNEGTSDIRSSMNSTPFQKPMCPFLRQNTPSYDGPTCREVGEPPQPNGQCSHDHNLSFWYLLGASPLPVKVHQHPSRWTYRALNSIGATSVGGFKTSSASLRYQTVFETYRLMIDVILYNTCTIVILNKQHKWRLRWGWIKNNLKEWILFEKQ